MKRTPIVVALALAAVALAQSTKDFSVSESRVVAGGGCADSGFTESTGADMTNSIGYNVVVSADRADAGVQTLFQAGSELCCAYLPVSSGAIGTARTSRWMSCPGSLNLSLASICHFGARDCSSGDYETLVGQGRITFVPSGVLVDGGNTATTTINVRRRQTQ